VLDDCGLARALACAEDVRAALANAPVIFEGIAIPVTTSIGIAERRDVHQSTGMLVRTADQALYRAKERGRNRVEA
jgi:two-component system cell cycle response regulator